MINFLLSTTLFEKQQKKRQTKKKANKKKAPQTFFRKILAITGNSKFAEFSTALFKNQEQFLQSI